MSASENTLRLVRNLRKGKHEKFAVQKAVARIRNVEGGTQHRIQPDENASSRKESHGKIYSSQTSLPDFGVRSQGEE